MEAPFRAMPYGVTWSRTHWTSPSPRGLGAGKQTPLLLLHVIRPALCPALAIEEREHGVPHRRRDTHLVVRQIGQNGESVPGHVLPLPPGILQSPPEEMIELDHVLQPEHVAIALDEHDRHLQRPDVLGPVL